MTLVESKPAGSWPIFFDDKQFFERHRLELDTLELMRLPQPAADGGVQPLLKLCIKKLQKQRQGLRLEEVPKEILGEILSHDTLRAATSAEVADLLEQLPEDTTVLHLRDVRHVDDHALINAVQRLPRLQVLNIEWNPKLTPIGLQTVLRHCPKLEQLYVSQCPAMNDAAAAVLASDCPQMTSLSAAWTSITDLTVASLDKLDFLQSLDISHCAGTTVNVTESLGHLVSLRTLKLHGLELDGMALRKLDGCAHLETLAVGYNRSFNHLTARQRFVAHPRLRVIDGTCGSFYRHFELA